VERLSSRVSTTVVVDASVALKWVVTEAAQC